MNTKTATNDIKDLINRYEKLQPKILSFIQELMVIQANMETLIEEYKKLVGFELTK